MEGTEETKMSESHLSSVVAFVEGGIQDACDDACSICLEDFCESDPSTVTGCKHEFHLQCILEWCQRSSQCPMCWQPISLKDPTSQELLGAVEQERNFRFNRSRNATIFHHPTLGDFELQHLPVDASEAELEEHIIQHLATAAAMGRTRHIARREGHRNRSSAQGRPQLVVFSTHPNAPPIPSSPSQRGEGESTHKIAVATPSSPPLAVVTESSPLVTSLPNSQGGQGSAASDSPAGSTISAANQHGNSLSNRGSPNRSSSNSRDRTGPSNFQSLSESIKSRFNAVSMRYKDSISKSTRGWKERFFSQNTSVDDIGSEVREVNAGVASVSRLMEHLETRDNSRTENASVSNANSIDNCSVPESNSQLMMEAGGDSPLRDKNANVQASCAASSGLH